MNYSYTGKLYPDYCNDPEANQNSKVHKVKWNNHKNSFSQLENKRGIRSECSGESHDHIPLDGSSSHTCLLCSCTDDIACDGPWTYLFSSKKSDEAWHAAVNLEGRCTTIKCKRAPYKQSELSDIVKDTEISYIELSIWWILHDSLCETLGIINQTRIFSMNWSLYFYMKFKWY